MTSFGQFGYLQFRSSLPSVSYNDLLVEKTQEDLITEFISGHVVISSPVNKTCRRNDLNQLIEIKDGSLNSFVALRKINNVVGINNFLKGVNEKLAHGGTLVLCAETLEQRRKRIFSGHLTAGLFPYYAYDFLINRFIPKLKTVSKLYFKFKKRNNRVLSLPEILGRLVYGGFRIIDIKEINNLTYFVARKEREPQYNTSPKYGIIFRMSRVGMDGKIIRVYKIRTMYPYSEYIQKFIYENFNLEKGGKFSNDIRITGWGKILRKYWLDEIPMLINWLKGDLKIVGLRPLSEHYLSLYNKNLAENRFTIKPGLIPPFYQDLPGTLEEIMRSEEKYIELYKLNPLRTDITYFINCLKNILLKGARSS